MNYNIHNLNDHQRELVEKLREVKKNQEQEIQQKYDSGEIPDYSKKINGNGKSTKKEQQQKEETSKVIYSQKYTGKDFLAEAVLIGNRPYFAVSSQLNDVNVLPSIVFNESIPLDETTILKPPEVISYLNKPYVFDSKEGFYEYVENIKNQGDLYSLFKDVKSIWKKYVDADDFHISICAADTIFTYLQDKLGLTHYLFFIGNNGSGKSNNLVIFHYLAYRNMMSTDVTAANIYQYLGNLQEGQGTLAEDEADNIDENTDKMKIYKNGYSSGCPVFRMDTTCGRKQSRFFTYCFKAFAAERTPDSIKAKGFNQRIIELHCSPGFPKYDISEVVNPAGEDEHQELLEELMETRKRLLIYRLTHFHNKIPDIKLNIENREKQLFKPVIRIFQTSQEVLDGLFPVISNYVSQRRESNADSLHSRIYQIIKRMVKEENSAQLESSKIWGNIKDELNGEEIKKQTIQTPEFDLISQKEIIQILKDVFKAKPPKRHGNARSWIFDLMILDKLGKVYDLDVNVKVKRKGEGFSDKENGTHETHQQNGIGLDKHIFHEGNNDNGTDGSDGTLYGDEIGLDKHISDGRSKENDKTHTQEIENNLENSDNSNHMLSKDNMNCSLDCQLIENNTLNDDAYSSNVSQASQMNSSDTNLFKCYRCKGEFSTIDEYTRHCHINHPKQPMYPELSLIKIMKLEPKGNPWEI